jgi:metallophosphoesterase (TIGR00282 family)
MNILFIGDIVAKQGRNIISALLKDLKDQYSIDYVIANGENAAGGFGITPALVQELHDTGIDIITTGNHIWEHKEIIPYLSTDDTIIRPMNISLSAPGRGWTVMTKQDRQSIAVVNLIGRVFMPPAECPFHTSDTVIREIKSQYPDLKHIVVDFHAEATSEKQALAWYLDGKVTTVIGTHTHVQTSDETILPSGTSCITDAGMTGVVDGVIGMDREQVISRFLTSIQRHFEPAKGHGELQGVVVTSDDTGASKNIVRVKKRYGNI